MAKNNLGQPTISDVVTFFCDPCNAILCAECPVNDILQAEKAAQQSVKPTSESGGFLASREARINEHLRM